MPLLLIVGQKCWAPINVQFCWLGMDFWSVSYCWDVRLAYSSCKSIRTYICIVLNGKMLSDCNENCTAVFGISRTSIH